MATGNSLMKMETGTGWSRGLKNALRGELRRWFRTRTWWRQILVWTASINLIVLMVALSTPKSAGPGENSVTIFNVFVGLVGPIGASIIMQSVLVGEKRSGTAAWVLSKPVSRAAFVLSKLVANAAGIAVTMVLAQGLIAYLIAALVTGVVLPVPGFLAGLGIHMVNILFYLTLTLMLGAIFDQVAPVIGISLAFLFAQNFIASFYPPVFKVLPWTLAIPLNNDQAPSIAMALMTGEPVVTYLPLFSTLVASILFVAIAVWVFQRQEL